MSFESKAGQEQSHQNSITTERRRSEPKRLDWEPKGLTVELMQHQKVALLWMLDREKGNPSGGLLADDMGVGKTLSMISLVLKSKELYDFNKEHNSGGTLIVSPTGLMNQWKNEIEKMTEKGLLTLQIHHGPKRNDNIKKLKVADVVITTYGIVLKEVKGTLGIQWRRVILDEAHQIRNHKSKTALAVFELSAKSRWALTGTPVQNTKDDMYALVKFLQYHPYDDYENWKELIADDALGEKGRETRREVISAIMMRRIKTELVQDGIIQTLPEKIIEKIYVDLDVEEKEIYQRVMDNSKHGCNQFFGVQKNVYRQTRAMKKKELNRNHIFVLLLVLRQICCHCYLITLKEQDETKTNSTEKINVLTDIKNVYREGSIKNDLDFSSVHFKLHHPSSKIKKLISMLKSIPHEDKVIVVSQWTSFLHIIAVHIKSENISFDFLTGKTDPASRSEIQQSFNDPRNTTKVLLLSLTAGGVGLNLMGANHLFLMDLHWNPQLENQAQDRIYRIGQTKPVFIYKLMTIGTIEERVKALQDKKLEVARSMLEINDKLSLEELEELLCDEK